MPCLTEATFTVAVNFPFFESLPTEMIGSNPKVVVISAMLNCPVTATPKASKEPTVGNVRAILSSSKGRNSAMPSLLVYPAGRVMLAPPSENAPSARKVRLVSVAVGAPPRAVLRKSRLAVAEPTWNTCVSAARFGPAFTSRSNTLKLNRLPT